MHNLSLLTRLKALWEGWTVLPKGLIVSLGKQTSWFWVELKVQFGIDLFELSCGFDLSQLRLNLSLKKVFCFLLVGVDLSRSKPKQCSVWIRFESIIDSLRLNLTHLNRLKKEESSEKNHSSLE